ncbi:MAG: hypothetical protein AAGB51_02330 [Planctomycetota bacterium]
MQSYIDGEPFGATRATVAAALADGAALAEERGRIVVEIEVDGQSLTGDDLVNPSDTEGAASEIRLTTAEPRSLVGVTLAEASEAIGVSAATHTRAATLLHQGDQDGAAEAIGEVLGTWHAVRAAFDHGAQLLGEDLLGELENASAAAQSLSTHLDELRQAVQISDWTAVADTLEHDLGPQTEVWAGMLKSASERVLSGAGGASAG